MVVMAGQGLHPLPGIANGPVETFSAKLLNSHSDSKQTHAHTRTHTPACTYTHTHSHKHTATHTHIGKELIHPSCESSQLVPRVVELEIATTYQTHPNSEAAPSSSRSKHL